MSNIEEYQGDRIASNLIAPSVMEKIALSKDIFLAEMYLPDGLENLKVESQDLINKFSLRLSGLRRTVSELNADGTAVRNKLLLFPAVEDKLLKGDILILIGVKRTLNCSKRVWINKMVVVSLKKLVISLVLIIFVTMFLLICGLGINGGRDWYLRFELQNFLFWGIIALIPEKTNLICTPVFDKNKIIQFCIWEFETSFFTDKFKELNKQTSKIRQKPKRMIDRVKPFFKRRKPGKGV